MYGEENVLFNVARSSNICDHTDLDDFLYVITNIEFWMFFGFYLHLSP